MDVAQSSTAPPRLIVGVGASAGGLDAFKALLEVLPERAGIAYIFVQHLDPTHHSLLAELLARATEIPVVEARDGARIEADTIYVIRPDTALAVDGVRLIETPPTSERGRRLPIDHLFRSMADTVGTRAVGVVLTGAGNDGAAGLRDIRARQGLTIAQTPSTATQPGMPQSAIDAGAVDIVAPIEKIPDVLRRFAEMTVDGGDPAELELDDEAPDDDTEREWMPALAALLETRAEFDLRHYKSATIVRRVQRRMRLRGFDRPEAYIAELREDAEERRHLVADLLIGVTEFFRDAEAFDLIQTRVVDAIIAQVEPRAPIRIWVAGCSSGEEAYSLAMIFFERLESLERANPVQIFATDIDTDALATARIGFYPASVAENVSRARLQRFFTRVGDTGYQVQSRLRDSISFAVHDLCTDPPFSRMHLVSCRNVLIYLRPNAQERVLRVLNFALERHGFLVLGSSETLGPMRRYFTPESKKWRIYKKIGAARVALTPPSDRRTAGAERSYAARGTDPARREGREGLSEPARRALLATRVPPSIVVSADGEVIYLHGALRPFLRFPEGEPRHDVWSMLRPEMATRVRAAIFKCRRDEETVVATSGLGDASERVRITASPTSELGPGAVVVSFEAVSAVAAADGVAASDPGETDGGNQVLIAQLERELRATREDLRSTVEELETSNEELRASNEESMSMNEELQSSNEELEATSEELRSLNEELTTVNAQLREKIDLLERAHDDIQNFFTSARLPILFLDDELRIKRLTPAAIEMLRVTRADIGRYAPDIARELLQNQLVDDARSVLEQLAPVQRELLTHDGRWITRRILPYRTQSRRIDGVVVSLTDVTTLKRTSERLAVRERQQSVIARLGLLALEERDPAVFFDCVVREVQQTLETDYCKLLELQPDGRSLVMVAGVGWRDGLVGTASVSAGLESQAGYTLSTTRAVIVEDLARERRFSGPSLLIEHEVVSGISCTIRGSDGAFGVIGAHTRSAREFTSEDAGFLEAVATIVSAATARHQSQIRLALEHRVSNALATAGTLEEAANGVFDVFGHVLDVCVGELWQLDADGAALGCSLLWTAPGVDRAIVASHFSSDTFAPDEGIVGRVFSRNSAEWLTPFRTAGEFVRRHVAAEIGLHSGFVWPVHNGERAIAVMTVFARKPLAANEGMLRALEGMGRTVGQVARRLEAESATRASERAFREIFDNAGVSLWVEDFSKVGAHFEALRSSGVDDVPGWLERHPEFVDEAVKLVEIVDVNDETRKLFGGRDDDAAIESLHDVFLDESHEAFRAELMALASGRSRVSGATTLRGLDGRRRDVTFTVRFPPEVGDLHRVIVSLMDVSELRATQRQLEQSRRWFNHLTEATPDAVAVLEAGSRRVVYLNHVAADVLGLGVDADGMLQTQGSPLHEDDVAATQTFFGELDGHLQIDGSPCEHTYRVLDGEGRVRWVHLRCVPFGFLDGSTGELEQILLVARDVTELKRAELELVAASRQKDEFLAMLGHELRNPLAAIRSAAELLRLMHTEDSRLQRTRSVLERQTAHMAKLLDGLLDVSRIVRGKITLDVAATNLAEIVDQVVGDKNTLLERRPIEMRLSMPDGPVFVDGDRVRLAQIVDNLVTNALKFTHQGTIEITVSRAPTHVELVVSDTGVGIPAELLPHIFESFQQAGQSLDRAHGGLGLGLALVHGLVELHGGTVTAESDGVGRGSRFVVQLPPSREMLVSAPHRDSGAGALRILVVEDNRDAAMLLKDVLEFSGHNVTLAYDGTEALDAIEADLPDVVICDLGLPGGLSGFDVARRVREQHGASGLVLVALSGYGRSEDKARAVEAGFDAHLTKPVDLAVIEDTIAALRPGARASRT